MDEDIHGHGAAVAHHEGEAFLPLDDTHEACLGTLDDFHHLPLGLVHFALGEHQHLDGVAVEGVVGVVGGYLDVLAALLVGDDVSFAALLHVDGSGDIVLRQQLVVNGFGVDLVFAFVTVLDEVFLLSELLHGAYHLLSLGLAVGTDA